MQRLSHVRREQDERVGVSEGEGYSAATSIEKQAGYNAGGWGATGPVGKPSGSTARARGPVGCGAVGLHAARATRHAAIQARTPGGTGRARDGEHQARTPARVSGARAMPHCSCPRRPRPGCVGLGAVAGVS